MVNAKRDAALKKYLPPDSPPGSVGDSPLVPPGDGEAAAAPSYYPAAPDLLGLGAQFLQPGASRPYYDYHLSRPLRDRQGRLYYIWSLTIYEARGGINRTIGDFDRDFDRLSSGAGGDSRFPRTLCLAQLTTNQATPDPTGTLAGIHHARVFDTLMVGVGSGANAALFRETSATNPALTAVTYSPGSAIICLSTIVSGGAGAAQALFAGLAGAAPQKITDSAGTIGATGHADINPTWGHGQTPINSDTNLFYANGAIRTLVKTSEISAAPTLVTNNIPNGGYALGFLARGGGPLRWYIWTPRANNTTGGIAFGSEVAGEVRSVNLEGGDMQIVNFAPYLKKVTWAAIYRDGVLATDDERLVWNNGRLILDLNLFADREANSDREFRIRGGWIVGGDLYVEVNHRAVSGGASATLRWVEYLDFESFAWHPVSAQQTLSGTGSFGVLGAGSLPWSDQTHFLHTQSDGSFRRLYWPSPGVNTYGLRKSSGAAAATGVQYEASGTCTWPRMELPGLEGMAKCVKKITYLGRIEDANTTATVRWDVGGLVGVDTADRRAASATFIANLNSSQVYAVPEMSAFDQFQPQCFLTQQSGGVDPTRQTPNAVPVNFQGYAWPKGLGTPEFEPELPGR